jgi:hypothetical protein
MGQEDGMKQDGSREKDEELLLLYELIEELEPEKILCIGSDALDFVRERVVKIFGIIAAQSVPFDDKNRLCIDLAASQIEAFSASRFCTEFWLDKRLMNGGQALVRYQRRPGDLINEYRVIRNGKRGESTLPNYLLMLVAKASPIVLMRALEESQQLKDFLTTCRAFIELRRDLGR